MVLSSTLTPTLILLLILSIQACTTQSSAASVNDFSGSACLRVSTTRFIDSVSKVIDVLGDVSSILKPFASRIFHNFRLTNAVSDCLDLIDMASEDLRWSISATQNPKGKHNSTGNLSSDLKTWLSAVLSHPETCIEGFEGTNSIVKGLVSSGLGEVMSLVRELLFQVVPDSDPSSTSTGGEFPSWVKAEDEKLLQENGVVPDAVVAADGSGNYTTVMEAVLAAPDYSMKRFVIYVKKGVYEEYVEIKKKKWNIMMVGDGMDVTVISGNRSFGDGWTTFKSATFAVSGRGFIARGITFQNTAGPEKHQAVALRSDSDLAVFFRCSITGYQDSLYPHTMRQFYKECRITGTVDFIFGDATAVFQNCNIQARKGLQDQKNTITAQGRKDPGQSSGFSFQYCNITADSELLPSVGSIQTYLGRPWKEYSRTVFMQSFMSDVVNSQGWLEWNTSFDDTLFYGEYLNYGAGAGVGNRVKWGGYHVLNDSEAGKFTVNQFIEGNLWLPSTGVAYTGGL